MGFRGILLDDVVQAEQHGQAGRIGIVDRLEEHLHQVAATAPTRDEHPHMVESGGTEVPPPGAAKPAGMVIAGDRKPSFQVRPAPQA